MAQGGLPVLALLQVFYAATDGVLAAGGQPGVDPRGQRDRDRGRTNGCGDRPIRFVLVFGGVWVMLGRAPALLVAAGHSR